MSGPSESHWKSYCAQFTSTGANGSTGGDESCACGGFDDLKDYKMMPASLARQNLVRKIAQAVNSKLGLKIETEGKDTAAIVRQMRERIPDPRSKGEGGNGKRWGPDADRQKLACRQLARILNEQLGTEVVRETGTPAEVCEQVSELLESLAGGMQPEFARVRRDTERIFKNLQTLKEAHDRVFAQLEGKIAADKESTLGVETSVMREFHKAAHEEMERQLAILKNMLDVVIQPSDRELHDLLRESKELKGFVRRIKDVEGVGFGTKLAYAMSGLTNAAAIAHVVQKALEELGIKASEFERAETHKQLKQLLESKLEQLVKSGSNKDLAKYFKLSKLLLDRSYMHGDLVEALAKKKGGKDVTTGGLKLDKRIKARQETRHQLLQAFGSRIGLLLKQSQATAAEIAGAVSAGRIPLGDKLQRFITALEQVPELSNHVYLALSGFYNTVQAREERQRYVSSLEYLVSTIDDLLKDKSDEKLKDLRRIYREVMEMISTYSDRFARGFEGIATAMGGEDAVTGKERVVQMAGQVARSAAEIAKDAACTVLCHNGGRGDNVGGDEYDGSEAPRDAAGRAQEGANGLEEMGTNPTDSRIGGLDPSVIPSVPEISRVADDLEHTKAVILYAYRVRMVRDSLKKTAGEIKHYGEDYTKVLADGIASAVDKLKMDFSAWKQAVEDKTKGKEHALRKELMASATGSDEKKQAVADEFIQQLVELKGQQLAAKVELYHTAEAMDLYMKNFTQAVDASPDDLKDIVRVLGETRMIAAWFTERSGDMLASVYDAFPSAFVGAEARFSKLPDATGQHYYLSVRDLCRFPGAAGTAAAADSATKGGAADAANPGLPGNPFLALDLQAAVKDGKDTRLTKRLEEAVKVTSLKNLLTTFMNVANIFGGKQVSESVPMTPVVMYRNLMRYMSVGSISVGLKEGAPSVLNVDLEAVDAGNVVPAVAGTYSRVGDAIRANLGVNGDGAVSNERQKQGAVAMRAIPTLANQLPFTDDCRDTDLVFTLILKSIVAKIFVAVGMYDLFNRPVNYNGLGFYSGLRLIMGGAEGGADKPKVIPEALELYARLPLLAEFYRRIFKFEGGVESEPDSFRMISMIPEADGTFTDLISFIFDKARFVTDGGYSETDISMLVEIINRIYARFAKQESPVQACILEFVAEINRRYGLIKRDDRQKFLDERRSRFDDKYASRAPETTTDFELEGLDEQDDYQQPLPSQTYETTAGRLGAAGSSTHKHPLELHDHQKYIRELRHEMWALFKKAEDQMAADTYRTENAPGEPAASTNAIRTNVSLQPIVKSRAEELKYAKSEEERFAIVISTINSLGQYAMPALERSLIAFHELVVAPLNVLQATREVLVAYRNRVLLMAEAVEALQRVTGDQAQDLALAAASDALRYYMLPAEADPSVPIPPVTIATLTKVGGTVGGLYALIATLGSANEKKDAAQRYLIRNGRLARHLIDTVYSHAATLDKLVGVRVEVLTNDDGVCAADIHVDHSKLTEMVEALLGSVKRALNKFRGLLPKKLFDKYESSKTVTGEPQVGSLYDIEKNLLDELIHGRGKGQVEKETLDASNRRLKDVLKHLGHKWSVSADAAGTALTAAPAPGEQHNYSALVNALLYRDGRAEYAPEPVPAASAGSLIGLLYNQTGSKVGNTDAGHLWSATTYDNKAALLYDANGIYAGVPRHDIFTLFNRLVAAHIAVSYDAPVRKVYQPALEQFANGAFGATVAGSTSANLAAVEITNDNIALTVNAIRDASGPLVRSLAEMLRHLMTDRTPNDKKMFYLEADLAEIPLYVKERYRAELPILDKMAAQLMKRCDYLKDIVRGLSYGGANRAAEERLHLGFLDEVVRGCVALRECIKAVLRDVGDEPKQMELSQNFNSEYRATNGAEPFQPASSQLYMLRRGQTHQPVQGYGSLEFKMHYATRKSLTSSARGEELKLSDFPGLQLLVKQHNQATDAKFHFTDDDVSKVLLPASVLTQYLMDVLHYRRDSRLMGVSRARAATPGGARVDYLLPVPLYSGVAGDDYVSRQAFALRAAVQLGDVIRMTESTAQKDQRRRVARLMEDDKSCVFGDRETIMVRNIIDLNIVPINIHALMREIPLVNLYNYAWTYDCLMGQLAGVSHKEALEQLSAATTHTGRELFGQLLLNPYANLDLETYQFRFSQIARGDLGFQDLAQPKYVAQEVYNKALFGEIYPGAEYASEPAAGFGHAHLRGKQQVVGEESRLALNAPLPATRALESLELDIFKQVLSNAGVFRYAAAPDAALLTLLRDVHGSFSAANTYATALAVVDGFVPPVAAGAAVAAVAARDAEVKFVTAVVITIAVAAEMYADAVQMALKTTIAAQAGVPQATLMLALQRTALEVAAPMLSYLATVFRNQFGGGPFNLRNDATRTKANGKNATVIQNEVRVGLAGPVPALAGYPGTLNQSNLSKEFGRAIMAEYQVLDPQSYESLDRSKRRDLESGRTRYFPRELHYIAHTPNGYQGEVRAVDVGEHKELLQALGKLRFDTILCRNLLWVANIQRAVLLKLRRDAAWSNSRVVGGPALLAPGITELYGNDAHNSAAAFRPGNYRY